MKHNDEMQESKSMTTEQIYERMIETLNEMIRMTDELIKKNKNPDPP